MFVIDKIVPAADQVSNFHVGISGERSLNFFHCKEVDEADTAKGALGNIYEGPFFYKHPHPVAIRTGRDRSRENLSPWFKDCECFVKHRSHRLDFVVIKNPNKRHGIESSR